MLSILLLAFFVGMATSQCSKTFYNLNDGGYTNGYTENKAKALCEADESCSEVSCDGSLCWLESSSHLSYFITRDWIAAGPPPQRRCIDTTNPNDKTALRCSWGVKTKGAEVLPVDAAKVACERAGDSCSGVTCRNPDNCAFIEAKVWPYRSPTIHKSDCSKGPSVEDDSTPAAVVTCNWKLERAYDQVTYNMEDAVAACTDSDACQGLRCSGWYDCWIFEGGLPDKHPEVWSKRC